MKIGIVTGTFHPEAGGPPTYLYNLCHEAVKRGHSPTVVTFGEPHDSGDYPYPVHRVSRRQSIFLRLVLLTWLVFRVGKDQDIFFVNDYGVPGLLANALLRRPMVMKIAGDFAWEFSTRRDFIPQGTSIDTFQDLRGGLRVRFLRWLQSLYVRKAANIITPSQYLKNIVSGWSAPGTGIQVIYNGVELPEMPRSLSAKRARQELGLDPRQDIILTVARLTPWKGVDRLIDVVGKLQAYRPEARLVVVGDGPELENLRRRAIGLGLEAMVTFFGHQPRERIPLFLRSADLFVLYSGYEGLSHVLLEAMSAGLPVVASRSGGNPELVIHEETGLTVDYGDDAALEQAIAQLLSDGKLGLTLAAGAKRKVGEMSWQRTVDQTLQVLTDVAALGGIKGKSLGNGSLDECATAGNKR